MKQIKQTGLILLPFILLGGFLLLTDPYNVPLVYLILPFVLFGIGVFRLVKTLLTHLSGLSPSKASLFAGILTSFLLIAAVLQSIRQLSLMDLLLLSALLIGLGLYLKRV